MTPMNTNQLCSDPNANPAKAAESVAGIQDQRVTAIGSEANQACRAKTSATLPCGATRKGSKWRWAGAAVSFCLGWYLFSVFNNGGSLHQASATSVPSDSRGTASSIEPPVQADASQQPLRSSPSAAIVEDSVSTAQSQMVGGGNSDRLRKIFEKSMQSADALK